MPTKTSSANAKMSKTSKGSTSADGKDLAKMYQKKLI